MINLIIVSRNKSQREEYALSLCDQQSIQPIDITNFDKESLERKDKKPALSIGIEDVRNLYSKLYLKPFKSPIKAVIIKDAQHLTIEAQNALLKVLEEPPAHTLLLLTVDSKESLLPTIRSRCKIIELSSSMEFTEKETLEFTQLLLLLQNLSVADALKLAETVSKDKEKALIWLEKIILVARKQLMTNISDDEQASYERYTILLQNLQRTHTLLKTTNINPRMTFEVLFLSQTT